ncbi:hypothetical protein PZH37_17150, partial [[Eubacterium] siraeum]|nr:hypothetical protein [[Eubacterium] siraeum]
MEMLQLLLADMVTVMQMLHLELLMQVRLEATVVVQTLHLEQVTNNSFGNHLGSFFSDKKTSRQKLLVFWLLF